MRTGFVVAAVLASAAALPGCAGTCVQPGQRIVVDVAAGADVNDWQGSGPQHVRYRVWALKDVAAFETLSADRDAATSLVDPQQDAARIGAGFGQPFFGGGANPGWITPASKQTLAPLAVNAEEQYAAIGIVVLYPQPAHALVKLDCDKHPGYEMKDGVHKVAFRLDGTRVDAGAP
jgi:predicted component of type VI protein secretion system